MLVPISARTTQPLVCWWLHAWLWLQLARRFDLVLDSMSSVKAGLHCMIQRRVHSFARVLFAFECRWTSEEGCLGGLAAADARRGAARDGGDLRRSWKRGNQKGRWCRCSAE